MIIAGVIAAPFGALITKKIPHRARGIVVGSIIILLSLRTILVAIL